MEKEKKEKLLEYFLNEMENSKKSRHTIINYRSDIVHFLESCPIENLTVETLRDHFDGLNEKSPTTKARHISSLKTFLNWCYKKDYIQNNPIYKIEKPKNQILSSPKVVERNSIEKVILSIEILGKSGKINLNNLKYRFLFTLMLCGGLKISEALNLKYEDLEIETQTLLVNSTPKRRVPIYSSELINLFKLYTSEVGISSGLIFKGGENEQKSLSYQAVNRFWRKHCTKHNSDLTLQQLRDCYAQELVKKGFEINIVSKLLGHKNIHATVKYLQ